MAPIVSFGWEFVSPIGNSLERESHDRIPQGGTNTPKAYSSRRAHRMAYPKKDPGSHARCKAFQDQEKAIYLVCRVRCGDYDTGCLDTPAPL